MDTPRPPRDDDEAFDGLDAARGCLFATVGTLLLVIVAAVLIALDLGLAR